MHCSRYYLYLIAKYTILVLESAEGKEFLGDMGNKPEIDYCRIFNVALWVLNTDFFCLGLLLLQWEMEDEGMSFVSRYHPGIHPSLR